MVEDAVEEVTAQDVDGRGRDRRRARRRAGPGGVRVIERGHEPRRRCAGCGAIAPQRDLRRLAVAGDTVVYDGRRALPGRGAYVCGAACASLAIDRRALQRSFRRAVSADPQLLESRPDLMAKKRVHEIAKQAGMSSKDVLAKLQAAGLEVKAAASTVEEADALKALGANGAAPQAPAKADAPTKAKAPEAAKPAAAKAPAAPQAEAPAAAAPRPGPDRRRAAGAGPGRRRAARPGCDGRSAASPRRPSPRDVAAAARGRPSGAGHRPADHLDARTARAPHARRDRQHPRRRQQAPDARRLPGRARRRRRGRSPPRCHRLAGFAPRARQRRAVAPAAVPVAVRRRASSAAASSRPASPRGARRGRRHARCRCAVADRHRPHQLRLDGQGRRRVPRRRRSRRSSRS